MLSMLRRISGILSVIYQTHNYTKQQAIHMELDPMVVSMELLDSDVQWHTFMHHAPAWLLLTLLTVYLHGKIQTS